MDDDDERDRLLSALQTKLAELDAQVAAYRRAQADEFRRYAALLISNVPPALAADVARTINQDATKLCQGALFPALLCEGDDNDTATGTPAVTPSASAPAALDILAPPAPPPLLLPSPSTPSSPAPFLSTLGVSAAASPTSPASAAASPAAPPADPPAASPAAASAAASSAPPPPPPPPPTVSRRPASPPPAVNQMPGTPMRVLSPAILPLSPSRMPILASSPSSRAHNDLSGVFTPPFLPLLEGAHPRSYSNKSSQVVSALLSPSLSPSPSLDHWTCNQPTSQEATAAATTAAATTTTSTTATSATATDNDAGIMSTDTMPPPYSGFSPFAAPSPPQPLSPSTPLPQTPKRPQLKSVLRWSSGSISPSTPRSSQERRVRFSFDGKEVLPTSSPPRQFDHDLSWLRPSHHIVDGFLDADEEDPEIDMGNLYESEFRFDANAGGSPGAAAAGAASTTSSLTLPPVSPARAAAAAAATTTTTTARSMDDEPLSPTSVGPLSFPEQDSSLSYFASVGSPSNDDSSLSGLAEPPFRRRSEPSLGSGDLDRHYEHPSIGGSSGAGENNSSPQHHRRRHSLILDNGDLDPMPLSRRMSSSDRLRALSKVPLEDPSMWTVVDPQSDPTAGPVDASSFVPVPRPDLVARKALITMAEEDEEDDGHDDGHGDDDDAYISMRPVRRESADSGSSETQTRPTTMESTTAAEAADTKAGATAALAEVDDPFFEFDDDEAGDVLGYPLSRVSNSRPYVRANEDEDEDEDEIEMETEDIDGAGVAIPVSADDFDVDTNNADNTNTRDAEKVFGSLTLAGPDGKGALNGVWTSRPAPPSRLSSSLSSSMSASRPIPARLSPTAISGAAADSVTTGPLSPTTMAASVGSYRGRPLSMFNVVKDPRILEEVAQLGEFSSFVGGVDGRTGVDDDESGVPIGAPRDFLGSYRGRDLASIGMGMSGTPRSLSERMAMEEAFKMR